MKLKAPPSNVEWTASGQEDPLYAVATCPERNKEGSAPWSDDAFYALGKADWQDFRSLWERYGLDRASCVEIGCGAGRMTRHMTEDFGLIHAFDISQHMLEYARRNVSARNVEFRRTTGADLPLFDCTVASVFSCHVFQHFDNLELAQLYFLESHRILSQGGTLMIHIPIYRWPNGWSGYAWLHKWQTRIADWKAGFNRRLIRAGVFRPLMRVLPYPADWVFHELPRMGFEQVEIRIVSLTRNGDPHAFVLARKGMAPADLGANINPRHEISRYPRDPFWNFW